MTEHFDPKSTRIEKRKPAVFIPSEKYTFKRVKTFADEYKPKPISAVRVYKMFQEGKIDIATIDGVQFVVEPTITAV